MILGFLFGGCWGCDDNSFLLVFIDVFIVGWVFCNGCFCGGDLVGSLLSSIGFSFIIIFDKEFFPFDLSIVAVDNTSSSSLGIYLTKTK